MAEKAEILLTARDTTGPAFASAQRNFQTLKASAASIAGRLAGIGAAVTASLAAFDFLNPKPVIDQADALFKLSQKTGIAVETLSGYQYAAKLADVSNEELSLGLKKLSLNIAAAARGEKEQANVFKLIGVSVVDAGGKVRATNEVFEDLADRLAGYNDNANRNAIANATLGKGFEVLIPLLADGKEGLKQAREELQKYGGVISKEFSEKAQRFNDNLTRLEQATQRLKIEVAGGLIDSLVALSEKFVKAAGDGNLLVTVLEELAAGTPVAQAGRMVSQMASHIFSEPSELEKATESARHLNRVVENLRAQIAAKPGDDWLVKRLAEVQVKADAANEALLRLHAASSSGGKASNAGPDSSTLFMGPPKPPDRKQDAPALPSSGGGGVDEAAKLLRKQLDGRLKALEAGLDKERDLFQFAEGRLAEQFQQGELSIDEYYGAKTRAQLDYLAKQQEGFTAEYNALRKHQSQAKTATEREDDENKINDVIAKQAKVFLDAGQAAEVSGHQQTNSVKDLTANLRELDAQLAELSGDHYAADLLRNAQQLDAARKVLAGKTGGDPKREDALEKALALRADINKEQEAGAQAAESVQVAEEMFFIKAQRAGLDRAETERGLLSLHEKRITFLDAEIERYAKLVERSAALNKGVADPALIVFYEQLKLARERAFDAKDPALLRFNELAAEGAHDIAHAFEDAVLEGGKLSDILRSLGSQLARLLINDLATQPFEKALTTSIKGVGESASQGKGGVVGGVLSKLFNLGGGKQPATGPAPAVTAPKGDMGTGAFTRGDHDTTPVDATTNAIDELGATAAASADTFGTSMDSLAASAAEGSGAVGTLPGVVGMLTNYLTQLLSSTLGTSGSGGGFAGLLTSLFGSAGTSAGTSAGASTAAASTVTFHEGGIVGGTAPVPGLQPNEVPAVLMGGPKGKREEVLHADDPRHSDNLSKRGPAFERFMTRLLWGDVPRYHDGGVVGTLDRGRMNPAVTGGNPGGSNEVRHAGDIHSARNASVDAMPPLQVFVSPPPNSSRDSATQAGVQIGQGIQRALRRKGGG